MMSKRNQRMLDALKDRLSVGSIFAIQQACSNGAEIHANGLDKMVSMYKLFKFSVYPIREEMLAKTVEEALSREGVTGSWRIEEGCDAGSFLVSVSIPSGKGFAFDLLWPKHPTNRTNSIPPTKKIK